MLEAFVALTVVGLFAVLSFGGWLLHRRQRHEEFKRVMERMRRHMEAFEREIGEALMPTMLELTRVIRDLVRLLNEGREA